MNILQSVIAFLWQSRLRRLFEAIMRRLLGKRPRIVLGPLRGFYFEGTLAHRLGIYELPVQKALYAHLKAGAILYDIGGYTGYLTLVAAKKLAAGGHVFVFEPLPNNIDNLTKNFSANLITNYTLIPQAVSNEVGIATLFTGTHETMASLVHNNESNVIEVPTITLDSFVIDHPWPTLVKVDVEGAEDLVLQGGETLLSSTSGPAWIIEVHSSDKEEIVRRLLATHHYAVSLLPTVRAGRKLYPRHLIAQRE